ncbi:hypothetical protein BJX99DRAFT_231733 [Aspergillus californicus]
MRKWQSTRITHCVIDHISIVSSSKPLPPSLHKTPTFRHFSSTPNNDQPLSSPRATVLRNQATHANLRAPHHSRPTPTPTNPTFSISRAMSSDDAYMSFLNKANADRDTGRSESQQTTQSSPARTETVDVNVSVPAPLTSVKEYYISDSDELFEPVALKWQGAQRGVWPGSSEFSKLISVNTDLSSSIETLSASSFDPKNQYASVFRAVRAAAVGGSGDGEAVDVKVYRVEVGTSRVEYYVVALGVEQGLLVGLRAKAIES